MNEEFDMLMNLFSVERKLLITFNIDIAVMEQRVTWFWFERAKTIDGG